MNIILIIILFAILMIIAWAIFGNKNGTVTETKTSPEKEQVDEPEKILRRRSADRAIEKEFPAEKLSADSSQEYAHDRDDASGQIQLPFPANDIIADGSRFKLYKRALINSEIYAKRGDIETAVSLFKGVKDRILDSDIKSKIESNINYLNHFRHRRDEDFKKKIDSASSGLQPGELRLKIDGPVPQTINIGIPDKSIINTDEIIQKLSEQITKELGTLKTDIERLKTHKEDRFDLDDYAEFSKLQNEFRNMKERLKELTDERVDTLKELNELRELKEDDTEKIRTEDLSPENNEILKGIRKEIDNLSGLKHSLDSLHNKIENMSNFQIPESKTQPSIIQAKYDSPIPIHFDPKPVIELLDRINQQKKEDRAETPQPHVKKITEAPSDDVSIDDLTTLEAEEILNDIAEEIIPPEEPLFEEPEIKYEEPVTDKEKLHPAFEETPVKDEDLTDELSDDEIEKFSREEEQEPEITEPVPKIKEPDLEKLARDKARAEEILKFEKEKEKEIERHIDAEEDPNDFDLLSDIGKIKDDSNLTDEDIFAKILKDDKNKNDDSAFEIIGDIQKVDQEVAFNDSMLNGRMKAEQDFYKKFIKADRIKKRELPILKVSYDFKKLPDEFSLSREKNILEYSFYKYKPMLEKADVFIKHRHVRDAINYYKVVLDQNIPVEFKAMIKKNIRDLTEYLEKYLTAE